jgi:hypothetical protein
LLAGVLPQRPVGVESLACRELGGVLPVTGAQVFQPVPEMAPYDGNDCASKYTDPSAPT